MSFNPVYDSNDCIECLRSGCICSSCLNDKQVAKNNDTIWIVDPETHRGKDFGLVGTYRKHLERCFKNPHYCYPYKGTP